MPSDDDRNKTRGNTTKSTTERIQQEIHRLHNFFVGWFTARVDDNDAVFQAGVVNSLHEDFHLVNPQGVITARAPLLEALREERMDVDRGKYLKLTAKMYGYCKCPETRTLSATKNGKLFKDPIRPGSLRRGLKKITTTKTMEN